MQVVEVTARLRVCRPARVLPVGPGDDFRVGARMLRMSLDPGQDFSIAFARRQLLPQGRCRNPNEIQKSLIQRAGELVLAEFTREGGAPLVEKAWQHSETTQPHTRAARRMLRQVGSGEL